LQNDGFVRLNGGGTGAAVPQPLARIYAYVWLVCSGANVIWDAVIPCGRFAIFPTDSVRSHIIILAQYSTTASDRDVGLRDQRKTPI